MKSATAKQKLSSEVSSDNNNEQSANPSGNGQLVTDLNEQAIGHEQDPNFGVWPAQSVENTNSTAEGSVDNDETLNANTEPVELSYEQTPVSGVCQPDNQEHPPTNTTSIDKLPDSIIVPIDTIEYDPNLPVEKQLTEQIKKSVEVPWGKLMVPVLVSRLDDPKNGKEWLLRKGLQRLQAAKQIGLSHIRVVVLDGSEEDIRLLIHEVDLVRRHRSPYQVIRQLADWYELLKHVHHVYKPGGNKTKNAVEKKVKALPPLEELIEKTTGLKKSAFFGKVQAFMGLEPTVVRPYLDKNPNCATASKELWVRDLSKFSEHDQKKLAPYLKKLANPSDAYVQAVREEAVLKAESMPQDEMFPIYHEPFWKNAERIVDGSVNLIATDPNWHLADDSEKGEMWTLHGIDIAPQMTADVWHQFGKLAAQKVAPDGYVAVMVGQQNRHEIDSILRHYLDWVWDICYLHVSGRGTVARKAGFASHFRYILVYRRKDAPKKADVCKKYIHDVVPDIPKTLHTPETILEMLRMERKLMDARIAEMEADEGDPLIDDVVTTLVRRGEDLKLYHPWAQDVGAWQEIIRRLSKAGDSIWEPFVGSGTTAIASVTCFDWHLTDGKWSRVPAPRHGIGCDVMECWAKIAKYRVWEAQHPQGGGSFLDATEDEAPGKENENPVPENQESPKKDEDEDAQLAA